MRASMRCSVSFLLPSPSVSRRCGVEIGQRREVARLVQRALEAREGLGRVRIGGERPAEQRLGAVDALLRIGEAILRQRAGDEEVARLGGAVAQRQAGALGRVRRAPPLAAREREVGEPDQRRRVQRQALDGSFVAGARVLGAIELDERLGGAGEHDGGGARVVGRGVGERGGGVRLLRQVVAGAGARVDVAQARGGSGDL